LVSIEAAVLTSVILVSDTGYIGLLVDTDQTKPANDHQALERVVAFYKTQFSTLITMRASVLCRGGGWNLVGGGWSEFPESQYKYFLRPTPWERARIQEF
jgi:hypothetical protein